MNLYKVNATAIYEDGCQIALPPFYLDADEDNRIPGSTLDTETRGVEEGQRLFAINAAAYIMLMANAHHLPEARPDMDSVPGFLGYGISVERVGEVRRGIEHHVPEWAHWN